jgi:hypothetical protein
VKVIWPFCWLIVIDHELAMMDLPFPTSNSDQVTITVPFMRGWISQWYATEPVAPKVWENVS